MYLDYKIKIKCMANVFYVKHFSIKPLPEFVLINYKGSLSFYF